MTSLVFSPDAEKSQSVDEQIYTIKDFNDKRLWVAWRYDRRTNVDGTSHATKVPYRQGGRYPKKARSDDPTTWRTLQQVAQTAIEIGGGFGICLGIVECTPGLRLGGIDLDCCRDQESGEIADWAHPVIKRFKSYTELSPSKKGCKILFLYRSCEWTEQIEPLLHGAKTGRQWKRPADHDHPPGIELYLQARFFAVTGLALVKGIIIPDDQPRPQIRVVEPDDLRWLVDVYGPKFRGKGDDPRLALPKTGTVQQKSKPSGGGSNDSSRSGRGYRWMRVFHRMGLSYQEARDRILNLDQDPDVSEWAKTKGMYNGERELLRVYEAARPPAGSVDDRLGEMARTFRSEGLEDPDARAFALDEASPPTRQFEEGKNYKPTHLM